MNYKVTFLMPTYNDEDTIRESISSLYQQDYDNWELIIINDGGNDLTNILHDFLQDKRIILIQNKENRGQLEALKNGISYITGDLITLFHSDDKIKPNSLKRLVSYFDKNKNKEIDGVFADLEMINNENKTIGFLKTVNKISPYSYIDILLRNAMGGILNDVFFVRKEYFVKTVVPNYLENDSFYWLSLEDISIRGRFLKVTPWYQYRISSSNYIHSDICKFLLFKDRFNIIYKLSRKYQIPFENIQSIFWRALYRIPYIKNIYSFTFHPIFTKRKLDTFEQKIKYRKYLLYKTKKVFYSIYGDNIPFYLKYIFDWYKNVNKEENIFDCRIDNRKNTLVSTNWKINDIKLFNKFKNKDSELFEVIDLLIQNKITKIITDNQQDLFNLQLLMRNISLPIKVELIN